MVLGISQSLKKCLHKCLKTENVSDANKKKYPSLSTQGTLFLQILLVQEEAKNRFIKSFKIKLWTLH